MTTNPYDFLTDGRSADHARQASGDVGIADGWTEAHGAAARFIGECMAAGAILGLVTEMARPLWGQRHG